MNDPFYPCENSTIVDVIFVFVVLITFILDLIIN
jgi:hypothetical protein